MRAAQHLPKQPGEIDPVQGARAEFDHVLLHTLQAQTQTILASVEQHSVKFNVRLHSYALVSAGQCTQTSVSDTVTPHQLPHERLFIQTPEAAMADIGPWLIELPAQPSVELIHALALHAADQSLTLLASPVKLSKLMAHMRSYMYGTLHLVEQVPVLLRYFDPRIGFDMVTHWPQDVQGAFMQPLIWWTGWDAAGQPRRIKGVGSNDTVEQTQRIDLSSQWSETIGQLSEPNLMVALLAEALQEDNQGVAAGWLAQIHPQVLHLIAKDALQFATHAQCTDIAMRQHICRIALLEHARFYTHPEVQRLMATQEMASGSVQQTLRALLMAPSGTLSRDWAQDRDPMLVRLYDHRAQVLLNTVAGALARGPAVH